MNDDPQQDRRRTLLIVLVALIFAILCWAPIGVRMFSATPPALPSTSEASNEPRP